MKDALEVGDDEELGRRKDGSGRESEGERR